MPGRRARVRRTGEKKFVAMTSSTSPGYQGGGQAAFGDPGVVDEDVDATQLDVGPGGEGGQLVEPGKVDRPHARLRRPVAALIQDGSQLVVAPGADADGRPGPGEGDGDGRTDS